MELWGSKHFLAPYGLKFRKGDIILIIPEYSVAADSDGVGRLAGRFGLLTGLIHEMDISWEMKAQSILQLGNPSLRSLYGFGLEVYRQEPNTIFYTEDVDDLGNPTELKIRSPQPGQLRLSPSEQVIQRLKTFQAYVEKQGGTVIIGLPWLLDIADETSKKHAMEFVAEYRKVAPVIYDTDYNLKTDKMLFGDTVYHLNHEGVKQRSEAVAAQLVSTIPTARTKSIGNDRE